MGHWGTSPLELAHVDRFDNFYLRITTEGSGRLLVNTTHFYVLATGSLLLKLAWRVLLY